MVEPLAVLVGAEDVYVGVGSPFTITCVITNVRISLHFYRISCFSLLLRLSSVKWRATVQESDTERKPDILHAHQSRCGHVVLPGDLTNSPSISTGLMGMLSIRSIVEQLDPSVHYTESYPRKMLYTQKVPPQFRISYCRTSICANNKKKFHQNLAKREYNEELYQGMVLKSR